ncbi:MAG: DUF1727 domain-containing protein [Eggerthellaceae bacterium]|nr:DUF1727 domain-containing protein [Eggerthellaceae bacterium]
MGLSFSLAKGVAKITTTVLRAAGRTAGALPGKLACRIDPNILEDLAPHMTEGSILVVATNGKTTVTNLLADILEADGRTVICNRGGANMTQGIVSVLLQSPASQWGVFEPDELYLAQILPRLRSEYVLLMDIFPDQLDRMGSTGRLVRSITAALESSPETTLIYNADDPNCRAVALAVPNPCIALGGAARFQEDVVVLAADAAVQTCPVCNRSLFYAWRQYGPLGDYLCPACGFSRGGNATLDAAIEDVVVGTDECDWKIAFRGFGESNVLAETDELTVTADVSDEVDVWSLAAPYGASYMVYNLTFAATCAYLLDVDRDTVAQAIEDFDPHNGRMEVLQVGTHETLVNLAKNPVGFNQNIQLICKHREPCAVGFFVNNNVGDGLDSSWVSKVSFEALGDRVRDGSMWVFAGGMCREELLAALGERGVEAEGVDGAEEVLAAAEDLPANGHIFLIANYTALPAVKAAAEAAKAAAEAAGVAGAVGGAEEAAEASAEAVREALSQASEAGADEADPTVATR